tara:strand:- start:306 stop:1334 length:1029 start_codon:yes stop_codon:yes gene_type:complete
MSDFKVNSITNRSGTSGPVIAGVSTNASSGCMILPKGSTEFRGGYRSRGIFVSGRADPAADGRVIDAINITTTGNAVFYGESANTSRYGAAVASKTRGVFARGWDGSAVQNNIEFITISNFGNSNDFGDLTLARNQLGGLSNNNRGIFAGGNPQTNLIDFVTIASHGTNASDFGDLLLDKQSPSGAASPTRGVFGGGERSPTYVTSIEYLTINTLGNTLDFGDLITNRRLLMSCSSATRGLFAGGDNTTGSSQNVIEYITIATEGDATDFGDMNVRTQGGAATTNSIRACFAGGQQESPSFTLTNFIDFVVIATTGNATDFGDLTQARRGLSGFSGSHGGIG